MSDERTYLLGRSDPRIALQSLKCHSVHHNAAVTDRLIYMDLIMDEAKVNGANWNTDKFTRRILICMQENSKSQTHFSASSVRAVCLLWSYFYRIYLKHELRRRRGRRGQPRTAGKNTHDPLTSILFINHSNIYFLIDSFTCLGLSFCL